MRVEDFEKLKNYFGYNIYENHLNEKLDLLELIEEIEEKTKTKFDSIESNTPIPKIIEKWLGIMKEIDSVIE